MDMRMRDQFPYALQKRPLERQFPCTAVRRQKRGQHLQQVAGCYPILQPAVHCAFSSGSRSEDTSQELMLFVPIAWPSGLCVLTPFVVSYMGADVSEVYNDSMFTVNDSYVI
jgi:hypothetical protein